MGVAVAAGHLHVSVESQGPRAGAAALRPFGFLWTTPFFLFILSMLYDRRRLPMAAVTAVGATFVIHTLVRYVFSVQLP